MILYKNFKNTKNMSERASVSYGPVPEHAGADEMSKPVVLKEGQVAILHRKGEVTVISEMDLGPTVAAGKMAVMKRWKERKSLGEPMIEAGRTAILHPGEMITTMKEEDVVQHLKLKLGELARQKEEQNREVRHITQGLEYLGEGNGERDMKQENAETQQISAPDQFHQNLIENNHPLKRDDFDTIQDMENAEHERELVVQQQCQYIMENW